MQRKFLIPTLAAMLFLGSTAWLATAAPPDRSASMAAPGDGAPRRDRSNAHRLPPAVRASLVTLRSLEHLYRESGRLDALPGLYRDVLAKTQNPMLRNVAYRHLAKLQSAPANADTAIATLRQSLDENIRRVNDTPKRH
jgi:hypothetical protein